MRLLQWPQVTSHLRTEPRCFRTPTTPTASPTRDLPRAQSLLCARFLRFLHQVAAKCGSTVHTIRIRE